MRIPIRDSTIIIIITIIIYYNIIAITISSVGHLPKGTRIYRILSRKVDSKGEEVL